MNKKRRNARRKHKKSVERAKTKRRLVRMKSKAGEGTGTSAS